eukprot:5471209-Prymnesium_polylepis.1
MAVHSAVQRPALSCSRRGDAKDSAVPMPWRCNRSQCNQRRAEAFSFRSSCRGAWAVRQRHVDVVHGHVTSVEVVAQGARRRDKPLGGVVRRDEESRGRDGIHVERPA